MIWLAWLLLGGLVGAAAALLAAHQIRIYMRPRRGGYIGSAHIRIRPDTRGFVLPKQIKDLGE